MNDPKDAAVRLKVIALQIIVPCIQRAAPIIPKTTAEEASCVPHRILFRFVDGNAEAKPADGQPGADASMNRARKAQIPAEVSHFYLHHNLEDLSRLVPGTGRDVPILGKEDGELARGDWQRHALGNRPVERRVLFRVEWHRDIRQ